MAIGIVATTLLAAIWWLWWRLPAHQVARLSLKIRDPKARADVEDNFRKTVGQALGGAAVLIGAAAAYLQFTQQQQASHDLMINNQVAKSFEQLGSTETATRLGGIYGLEGVMNSSEQYHQPVLEALCAFVRESTTRRQGTLTAWLKVLLLDANERTTGKVNDAPTTDVQAALRVIARRNPGRGRVNLAGANIPGADLFGALEGADLHGVHLEGVDLFAHLEGAFLNDAHLERAALVGTHLEGANLMWAHLEGARLSWAHFEGANLFDAHLEGADSLRWAVGLTQAQIDVAFGDAATRLPDGLTRPARWGAPER
jgi:uncharacterized protein YjbI with pentapeptide repeats